MLISNDILYVGVDDRQIDLFEGQYRVPNGISYNSYVIIDDKIAVMDTVDVRFTKQWLDNIARALRGRTPDYLIVQHMEPDHSASIAEFLKVYPNVQLIGNVKTFNMIFQFFGDYFVDNATGVKDGDTLSLGKHTLTFVFAPMVHWPEVMMTYDSADKVLFSADGFGKFGVPDAQEEWADEARRYFIGIVGKYGAQVQNVLKKAATLDISAICPLHGPVLNDNLGYYINLYNTWSSYQPESDGIVIAYTSVYGHTKKAVELLAAKLRAAGCPEVVLHDLARCDMAQAVADAFRYNKLVLATTTYNADIFPFMRTFIEHLTERNFRSRTVALMENGSWAPMAAKVMRGMLENSKNITWAENTVRIMSALNDENREQIDALTNELCMDYKARSAENADKHDMKALYKLGYGLYVVTTNDGNRDNAMIINTAAQVADAPNMIAITVNKKNYTHDTLRKTGICNLNCLDEDAPFAVFEKFGFHSGRNTDKFADSTPARTDNGLVMLPNYINAVMSLKVRQYIDLSSHGMFICEITEARVISEQPTMTYAFYHKNVKPKPQTDGKKGYVCKICGYIYEGDDLPEDFICPLCKHPASDFEPIK